MIILLAGDYGDGKTFTALSSPTPSILIDLEDKAHLCKDRHFKDEDITIKNCLQYYTDRDRYYRIDSVRTLQSLDNELMNLKNKMIANDFEYKTVILDNISNLRTPFGVDEWLLMNPGRKKPKTKGDWSSINTSLKNRIFPLINMCKDNAIDLILTVSLVDKYGMIINADGQQVEAVVGKELGVKGFVKQWCTHIVILSVNDVGKDVKYIAKVSKSPYGRYSVDITNASLIEKMNEEEKN